MKRFWTDVTYEEAPDGGWRVLLDGRVIRTQGGAEQVLPSEPLAQTLAREWAAQGEEVDPAAFPHRDLADYAIDQVAADRAGAIAKLLAFAETDTLSYRADPEDALYRRQQGVWEPILRTFESREGVEMPRISGIVHRKPVAYTMQRLRERLEAMDDFTLAALGPLASLPASLTIGLSAIEPDADIAALWDAANLEEAWQTEQWGTDAEALERLERRRSEFETAAAFARAARSDP